jgi:peptidoglycan/LPS O-acetylase OafA/YrhL
MGSGMTIQPPAGVMASSSQQETALAAAPRYRGLDAMRFLAAVAIIYLHTVESSALLWTVPPTRVAVPFFAAAAAYLAYLSLLQRRELSFARYAWGRIKRLYVPYLGWAAVYYVAVLAAALALAGRRIPELQWPMLWGVSEGHQLWFLPFILLVTLGVFGVARVVKRKPGSTGLVALLAITGGLAIGLLPGSVFLHVARFDYMLYLGLLAMPAVLGALALAIFAARRRSAEGTASLPDAITRWGLPLMVVSLGVFWLLPYSPEQANWLMFSSESALTTGDVPHLVWRSAMLEGLAGVGLLLWCLRPELDRGLAFLAPLGTLAYGMYLMHVLLVEGMQVMAIVAGYTSTSAGLDLAVFASAVVLCMAGTSLLRKVRPLKVLFPE